MECYNIPCQGSKLLIKVSVSSLIPVKLVIKGYDPLHANSIYFDREIEFFSGTKEFDIPMPISPEKLKICAYDAGKMAGDGVRINYVKAVPLVQFAVPFMDRADIEFYNFMEKFAKEAGYIKAGGKVYYSPSGDFEIKLSDRIYNEDGTLSTTPARTFRPHGEIEVSKEKFDKMTVFMRIMILLHERMHIRADTEDEEVADRYAAETYARMEYPKTEALYSFIKVFTPLNRQHEEALLQRTDKLNNFLKYN